MTLSCIVNDVTAMKINAELTQLSWMEKHRTPTVSPLMSKQSPLFDRAS
jgi:hypothetical protein